MHTYYTIDKEDIFLQIDEPTFLIIYVDSIYSTYSVLLCESISHQSLLIRGQTTLFVLLLLFYWLHAYTVFASNNVECICIVRYAWCMCSVCVCTVSYTKSFSFVLFFCFSIWWIGRVVWCHKLLALAQITQNGWISPLIVHYVYSMRQH